jgi:hypothetical protein
MTKTYAKHGDPDYNSKTAAGCEADGEPVFTLRAQDVHAPEAVRFWAALVTDRRMAEAGREIAIEMERWPVRKEPD